jgi:hypothetical protein
MLGILIPELLLVHLLLLERPRQHHVGSDDSEQIGLRGMRFQIVKLSVRTSRTAPAARQHVYYYPTQQLEPIIWATKLKKKKKVGGGKAHESDKHHRSLEMTNQSKAVAVRDAAFLRIGRPQVP